MKYKILSIAVANALAMNANAEELSFWEGVSGNVGGSVEFSETVTDNKQWGFEEVQKEVTNEIGQIFLTNSNHKINVLYSLKTYSSDKKSTTGSYETENGYKHLAFINKGFDIGNGFTTGIQYDVEYITTKVAPVSNQQMKKDSLEQLFKPYLQYWNSELNFGFYSHFEYRLMDLNFEDDNWADISETSYSLLFRPSYRWNNFEFGLELFHQIKDAEHRSPLHGGRDEDFTETYIEPSLSYSFEDYGTFYTRVRIGENETLGKGPNDGDEYYTDILKTTVGYEQNVGDDWIVKAEYEFTRDEKSKSDQWTNYEKVDELVATGNTVSLNALYRF